MSLLKRPKPHDTQDHNPLNSLSSNDMASPTSHQPIKRRKPSIDFDSLSHPPPQSIKPQPRYSVNTSIDESEDEQSINQSIKPNTNDVDMKPVSAPNLSVKVHSNIESNHAIQSRSVHHVRHVHSRSHSTIQHSTHQQPIGVFDLSELASPLSAIITSPSPINPRYARKLDPQRHSTSPVQPNNQASSQANKPEFIEPESPLIQRLKRPPHLQSVTRRFSNQSLNQPTTSSPDAVPSLSTPNLIPPSPRTPIRDEAAYSVRRQSLTRSAPQHRRTQSEMINEPVMQTLTPARASMSRHSRNLSQMLSSPSKHSPLHTTADEVAVSIQSTHSVTRSTSIGHFTATSTASLSIDTRHAYSDRFIPSRTSSNFDLPRSPRDTTPSSSRSSTRSGNQPNSAVSDNDRFDEPSSAYDNFLRNELFGFNDGENSTSMSRASTGRLSDGDRSSGQAAARGRSSMSPSSAPRVFRFRSPLHARPSQSPLHAAHASADRDVASESPRRAVRAISRTPYRVLDAPALKDDFYLNLLDWSSQNVVAVGLGSSVYLWSAATGAVTKLCDLTQPGSRHANDMVTSVTWAPKGGHLAVGTHTGVVQVWDVTAQSCIRSMRGHSHRVGVLAWSQAGLATGSRDRKILIRDVRSPESSEHKYSGHSQEVCGLKWSPSSHLLASGGNDNKMLLWSTHHGTGGSTSSGHNHRASASSSDSSPNAHQPLHRFNEHQAAVKALAWSHDQYNILASGAGTADRCIRQWNCSTNQMLTSHDTGSQVCQLAYSRTTNELVSTHGYSLNQIVVWKLPSMRPLATLTGHAMRVLYLAMSPDYAHIVTGAGDETLRFWSIFPSAQKHKQDPRAASIGQSAHIHPASIR